MVPPDEFIPLAEQNGLIVEIGDWVLREACAQVRRWRDADVNAWQVAVNVSGVQFRDGTLVRRVADAIAAAGIDPRMIELEFTEGALIEYSTAVSKAVNALKDLGVATALDDFGTGYSSMSYLRHFPVDTLKIDRVFVRDITSQTHGQCAAGRCDHRHGEEPRARDRRRGRGDGDSVAVPQGLRCHAGPGLPVLPAAADRRSGALAQGLAAVERQRDAGSAWPRRVISSISR